MEITDFFVIFYIYILILFRYNLLLSLANKDLSVKARRPININVFHYRFPLPAIASILHRVTGVILFLLIPFMLWLLQSTITSPTDFEITKSYLANPILKCVIWGGLVALFYHLFAGIRHLIMDLGHGESLAAAQAGSKIIIGLSALAAVLVGVWLW